MLRLLGWTGSPNVETACIVFGHGTVEVGHGTLEEKPVVMMSMLSEAKPVGAKLGDPENFPPNLVLQFDNEAGLDVLLHCLLEVKKSFSPKSEQ